MKTSFEGLHWCQVPSRSHDESAWDDQNWFSGEKRETPNEKKRKKNCHEIYAICDRGYLLA